MYQRKSSVQSGAGRIISLHSAVKSQHKKTEIKPQSQTVRNCNLLMQNAVKAMNDPNIILFDAYSVVSAGGTYMASGYGAGDGIHLAGHVYQKLLNSLAIVLDQYSVRQRLS